MAAIEENFENVFISDGGRGITLYNRTIDGDRVVGSKLGTFSLDEYDVRISFKRKPRPIVEGSVVKVSNETGGPYKVIAVYADPNGWPDYPWAWIYSSGLLCPRTVYMSNLRHADED